jgi:hypothetical protein
VIDHSDIMARAREAWQGAVPSENEIRRGAERVGKRLQARPRLFVRRPMVVSAAACAGLVAALAYAASHNWIEVPRNHDRDPRTSIVSSAAVPPTSAPLPEVPRIEAAPPSPTNQVESPLVVPPPSVEPVPKANAPLPAIAPTADGKESPGSAPSTVPSWAEVSDALSGGDEPRAQKLLSDLARRGHDANDRAKAKLGLAQLEASHGNCERARVLALQVAAIQGIELKTVRRALELATSCAK